MEVKVVCPNCSHTFENNKINGIQLLEVINHIDSRKKMYCKLALDDLERISKANEGQVKFPQAKKIVLDNFNDFVRNIQTILGWGTDVE